MTTEKSTNTLMHLGWYLDTSLFRDFIDKNIRIGFDAAEVHDGHTLLHIKGLSKTGSRIVRPHYF